MNSLDQSQILLEPFYSRGKRAYKEGELQDSCPFPEFHSCARESWLLGWKHEASRKDK